MPSAPISAPLRGFLLLLLAAFIGASVWLLRQPVKRYAIDCEARTRPECVRGAWAMIGVMVALMLAVVRAGRLRVS